MDKFYVTLILALLREIVKVCEDFEFLAQELRRSEDQRRLEREQLIELIDELEQRLAELDGPPPRDLN